MRAVTASAPGKIILFGEHAVVHGQPAIAVPLAAVQATASVEPAPPGSGLLIEAPAVGGALRLPDAAPGPLYDALGYPAELVLDALRLPPPDLRLAVRSTIPIAAGLGSGAALAAAIMRALAQACERPLPDDVLNALVYEVERRHHGNPSGIDNTVIVYETPVYFVRGAPVETFRIARPFTLVVADTGVSSPTRAAVADVDALYRAQPDRIEAIFARIGALTNEARAALERGAVEALGPLLDENHALLQTLSVSSDRLDALCEAARAGGAWGAKLSGSGRGGNIIALAPPERAPALADILRRAGAVRALVTTVQPRT